MTNIKTKFLLILMLLASLTIACRMNIGGPKSTEEILVSADSASGVTEAFDSAGDNILVGSPFVLTFSQEEITSYLFYEMGTSSYGITKPQVFLEDGLIVIYGQFDQDFITANAKVTLKPYLDPSGTLKLDLVSVDLGPIPAPDSLLSSLSSTIDQSLQKALVTIPEGYQINSIEIANGLMTIIAQKL